MKLSTFFLLTHAAAASTVAAVSVTLCQTAEPLKLSLVAALTVVAGGAAAWRATRWIRSSVTLLEAVVADHERSDSARVGLAEFDRVLQTVGKSAQRWETAAATTRRQKRELQTMIGLLGGSANGEPTSGQLRELLAALGDLLHQHHGTIERAAADIGQGSELISEANDAQRHTLGDAASCIDQLSTAVDSFDQNLVSATATGQRSSELATAALAQLRDLIASCEDARTQWQRNQQATDQLVDRSQNSGDLAVWLEELTDRAHLLGLNASLQSLPAREHVAGSPDIADEAGALAINLQEATNRVARDLDAMQRVSAERTGGKQQDERDVETIGRAVEIAAVLTSLCQALDEHTLCLRRISESSSHQRRLSRQLRSTLKQCTAATQTQHAATTSLRDTLQTLASQMPVVDHRIDRLRSCAPGAATVAEPPANELSTPISAGFSVALPDHPFIAGGTA